MGLDSALLTATSGLRLVSRQMAQASQNIANAATPGYARRQVPGESVDGGGVRALEPLRDLSESLRAEARTARSDLAGATLRDDVLAPLAQLQGDPASGGSVAGLAGALRDAFTALRAAPSDAGAQGGVLIAAQDFAGRSNAISGAIGRARQSVQDGLRADVDQANGLLREVARLDAQIRIGAAAGQPDAEALDRRDAALARLSDLIEVTPVGRGDGGVTLILRGGSVLPLDPDGSPLSVAGGAQVSAQDDYGPPAGTLPGVLLNGTDITGSLKGGRIGAALELRDRTLPLMQAELDLTAAALARRLDDQGLRLFTDGAGAGAPPAPDPAAYPGAVVGFAGRIALSAAVRDNPRLVRDGTHAAPGAGFAPNPSGGPSGFTGLVDAVLDRSFGAGNPAIPGSGLGPGGTLASGFAPPARILDYAAAATAGQAATAAAAAEDAAGAKAAGARLDGLLQRREGVDVDQEMAALLQLQNAYAANARVMATVQSMWDALLGAVR